MISCHPWICFETFAFVFTTLRLWLYFETNGFTLPLRMELDQMLLIFNEKFIVKKLGHYNSYLWYFFTPSITSQAKYCHTFVQLC